MAAKIYVMSDLHGEYKKFLQMLEQIQFQDDDILFILGDIIDRGPQPISLLLDLSVRSNVFCILGNHEYMALQILQTLDVEITEENWNTQLTPEIMQGYLEWMQNGGAVTLQQYRALDTEDREGVLEFLEDLVLYDLATVGGQCFVLVHAGFLHFSPDRPLDDYAAEELIFERTDYEIPYFSNAITITGHTPTLSITGKPQIYRKGNHINIDCGACYTDGKLACLCLNTMEEFYV